MLNNVYYGQISQNDVERLLGKYGKDGSYLLRDSQSERGAFMSLCQTETKENVQWFQSLDKLIESFKKTPHSMVPLLYPFEKSLLNEEERQMKGELAYMEI